jgi:hypothetical protein
MAKELLTILQNKQMYASFVKRSQKRSALFTEEKMLKKYQHILQGI